MQGLQCPLEHIFSLMSPWKINQEGAYQKITKMITKKCNQEVETYFPDMYMASLHFNPGFHVMQIGLTTWCCDITIPLIMKSTSPRFSFPWAQRLLETTTTYAKKKKKRPLAYQHSNHKVFGSLVYKLSTCSCFAKKVGLWSGAESHEVALALIKAYF